MSLLGNLSAWPDEEQGLIPSQELSLQNVGASVVALRARTLALSPCGTVATRHDKRLCASAGLI